MPYVFNPFTGSLDNAPSTNKGNSAYTTVQANSSTWGGGSIGGLYLPLSGGTLTGKLTAGYSATESGLNIGNGTIPTSPVVGDLWMQQYSLNWYSPAGVQAAAMTNGVNIFNKAQIIEANDSTRPALRVTQNGNNNAILVEDSTNPDSTPFVINSLGNVGVGLSAISDTTTKLTVIGNVSATAIIYASGGNSNIWNEAYTVVRSNSASWAIDSTTDTGVRALTSNWQNTFTTVQDNSATWDYQGSDIKTLTAGWVGGNDAYTNLVANSAAYLSGYVTDLSFLSVSGNWNSVYSTVNVNSATNWNYQGSDIKALSGEWVGGNLAYTNLVSNSAAYLSGVDLSFLSVSANWDSNYTTVQTYSAYWGSNGSDVSGLSANWQSTYTTVSSNSAYWESAYTTLQTNSATWNTIIGGTSQVLIAEVKNAEGITLNRGDVVYTFGATGGTMSVKLASDANDGTSSKTIGLVNGTIAAGGTGYITTVGRIDQLNLGSYSEGEALWLGSTPGTFTNVRPTAPKHAVYLGVVERANNGNGIAYIKIQNGYELGELHDVLTNGSVQAGDFLQRNATNTLWVPSTLSADKWNSSYTTVQSNSATTWNYQGSDLKSLSANWQSAYTTLSSNSASYVRTNTSDATPVYFIRALTQTQYDAISIKDPNTLYFITT